MKLSISFGFLFIASTILVNAEIITSRNFEDFTVGAGNLVPNTGAGTYDGFYYFSGSTVFTGGDVDNDPYQGISDSAPLNGTKVAYLGGSSTDFSFGENGVFGYGLYSGYEEIVFNDYSASDTPVIVASVDFMITRNSGGPDQWFYLYFFDAMDENDPGTNGTHSLVGFDNANQIWIQDNDGGSLEPVGLTYQDDVPYRIRFTIDYATKKWSAVLTNLIDLSSQTIADERSHNGSGWTSPEGPLDIETNYYLADNDFGNDILYFDNLRIEGFLSPPITFPNLSIHDFEDFTPGASNLIPGTGTSSFGGNYIAFYEDDFASGIFGDDPYQGISNTSPLNNTKIAYLGGGSSNLSFVDIQLFVATVFPGEIGITPTNFAASSTPVLDVSIDLLISRGDSGPGQPFYTYFIDFIDGTDPSTNDSHSWVGFTSDGRIEISNTFEGYSDTGLTYQTETPYRLRYVVNYAQGVWSAVLINLNNNSVQTIAVNHAHNASGWTSAVGPVDIETIFNDTANGNDTFFFDNYTVKYLPNSSSETSLEIGSAVELMFSTTIGKVHQVQYTFDLDNWLNFGDPIIGTGEDISVFISVGPLKQEFYRIVEINL